MAAVESIVVAVSFVVFVASLAKPVSKAVLGMLDDKILKVSTQLDEAERLRKEAEEAYELAELRLKESEELSGKILKNARDKASELLANVENEVTNIIARKTEISMQRIAQQEKAITEEIQNEAVIMALQHVESALMAELSKQTQSSIVLDVVSQAKKLIH